MRLTFSGNCFFPLALFACLSPGIAFADEWGTVSGQVVIDGDVPKQEILFDKGANVRDKEVCAANQVLDDSLVVDAATKGIGNVFVYLKERKPKVHPDLAKSAEAEVVFDQKACVFAPHAIFVRSDQKVRVLSDDAVAHNTHTFPLGDGAVNITISPNDRKGQLVPPGKQQKLPYAVTCDIHPNMKAYWLVLDHPYGTVTDKEGKFKLENVPAGEQSLVVWQERMGYVEKELKVNVKADGTVVPVIKVPADKLAKKK